MTRRFARAMLTMGLVLALVAAVAVLTATLSSGPAMATGEVPITSISALTQGTPLLLDVPLLGGLEAKARRERGAGYLYYGWSYERARTHGADSLPVYLVRDGDEVRGFIALDPRNGCDLQFLAALTRPWGSFPTMFNDVCHGSSYDLYGNKIGGPTPWTLDQLVITVRDGRVFAKADQVLPGHLVR